MRRRLVLLLILTLACPSHHAIAAGSDPTPHGAAPVAVKARAGRDAQREAHPPAKASSARRDAASTRAGAAKATAARRTLDEIHIEGEMPTPQVLFVTARAQRRFLESHHGHYLPTSLELAERTTLPARFVVTRRPEPRP
jgi:hypothetical protein